MDVGKAGGKHAVRVRVRGWPCLCSNPPRPKNTHVPIGVEAAAVRAPLLCIYPSSPKKISGSRISFGFHALHLVELALQQAVSRRQLAAVSTKY
jgi:hypothetical protein